MNDFDIKKLLAPYLAKWYWIGLSAFIAVFTAWVNLRYSTNMYESVASIKIKDEYPKMISVVVILRKRIKCNS